MQAHRCQGVVVPARTTPCPMQRGPARGPGLGGRPFKGRARAHERTIAAERGEATGAVLHPNVGDRHDPRAHDVGLRISRTCWIMVTKRAERTDLPRTLETDGGG